MFISQDCTDKLVKVLGQVRGKAAIATVCVIDLLVLINFDMILYYYFL